jgi:hypothetical protein
MAMPKKGSRPIEVEGVKYRWLVRSNPTYSQGSAWSNLTFAVELESSGQQTLLVTAKAARPDNWLSAKSIIITPAIVESAIREALLQGWHPTEKGSAYELQLPLGSN